VIRVDAATVLLQWAAGGLFFLWFTTRRREVGVGYGWLLRGTNVILAAGAAAAGFAFGVVPLREASSVAVALAAFAALVVSIVRRKAGVSGYDAEHDRRTERVAAMTGIDRAGAAPAAGSARGREYPPLLDLLAPALAVPGLVAAALDAGGNDWVSLLRTFAGAAFLGSVTDAMLLGHWYLVQPGLPRRHLNDLVRALGWVWPGGGRRRCCCPRACSPCGPARSTTGGAASSVGSGRRAQSPRWCWCGSPSGAQGALLLGVMAATGLLYLAILTAFGTDLVARAILAG
jgi:hypothetical protein